MFLDVDQVLVTVGGLGKFQKLFGLFLCFTVIPWTFSMLLPYFVQHDSAWRCSYNSSVCNFSGEITGSSPKDIHNYRCSLPRKEWTFTKPRDYSVVTQVRINGLRDLLLPKQFMVSWHTFSSVTPAKIIAHILT